MYRLIVLAYNLAWLIYNIYKEGGKLFIFLTNWTYTLLNFYFVLATTLSCIALYNDMKNREEAPSGQSRETAPVVEVEMGPGNENNVDSGESAREKDALRWDHKLLWLIYTLSATGGLWITVGYWTVLVEDDTVDANNITKHALNSVFMLIDTCLSSIPVRLVHWLYVLLYFVVYLLFSVIYWQLGGTDTEGNPYIYRALNYNDFKAKIGGLLVVFLLLVLPLLHLFWFGVTKLRNYLHKWYLDRRADAYGYI